LFGFHETMLPKLFAKLTADLEAVVLAGDAPGVDEELSERFEDAVAVGGAEVEVLVGEDVGDVVDDGLVHLLDDVVGINDPRKPRQVPISV